MKKFFTYIIFLAIAVFTSCTEQKCKVCNKDNAQSIEICEENYSSNSLYGAAIDDKEFSGFICEDARINLVDSSQ